MRTGEPKRILVVEDDADAAEAMSLLLQMQGYAVSRAANGREALERLNAEPQTSLIILDLFMPEMDGRTFLRTMRQDRRFQTIPVIVVSAWAAAAPAEVEAAMAKPVDIGLLLATVARILSR
jgi:CheY-like chemotaxis protein